MHCPNSWARPDPEGCRVIRRQDAVLAYIGAAVNKRHAPGTASGARADAEAQRLREAQESLAVLNK